MIWIAPSQKDTATATLEKRLWDAADQFRANSGLKAQEYSGPILGIIFLRFAEVRFAQQRAKLAAPSPAASRHPLPAGEGRGEGAARPSRRGSRVDDPAAYHADGILYLPAEARFDYLLNLPEAQNIGAKVNDANSASDARSSEMEIRRQIIESRVVDAMVAVGPNLFYTVTLPCTLWFFDKGKARSPRKDTVLFIDARHIYRQIDRAHRELTPAQIGFMANLVRMYRGEALDFTLGGEEARAKILEVFATQPSPQPSPKGRGSKANDLLSASGRGAGGEGSPPTYRDVPGLCKAAKLDEIAANGWSLNPGRYVGVAPGEAVSDEDFKEQLETLNEELETLNAQARELEATIASNVTEILEA